MLYYFMAIKELLTKSTLKKNPPQLEWAAHLQSFGEIFGFWNTISGCPWISNLKKCFRNNLLFILWAFYHAGPSLIYSSRRMLCMGFQKPHLWAFVSHECLSTYTRMAFQKFFPRSEQFDVVILWVIKNNNLQLFWTS